MARKLILEIVADPSALTKGYKQAERSTQQFGKSMDQMGRGVLSGSLAFRGMGRSIAFASTAFLGGAGLTSAIRGSIEAASSLNEQISKTNVIFGSSAKAVENWSKSSATSMGLARDQALAAASSFGALFQPLGIVGTTAAQQSEKLTQLGGDLASFYNTDVQSALDAIRSGLVGESEPLRNYGVQLSEVRVQQEALAETGKKHAAALTNEEKVLARIKIIYQDTVKAQGDFQRTSAGLANQQRILSANIRNLGIAVGGVLYPSVNRLVGQLNDWLKSSENQKRVTDGVREAVRLLKAALDLLVPIIKTAKDLFDGLADAVGGSENALKLLAGFAAAWKLGGIVTQLTAANGQALLLRGRLGALGKIGVITIGVELLMHPPKWAEPYSGSKGFRNLGQALLGGDNNAFNESARRDIARRTGRTYRLRGTPVVGSPLAPVGQVPQAMRDLLGPLVPAAFYPKVEGRTLTQAEKQGAAAGAKIRKAWAEGATSRTVADEARMLRTAAPAGPTVEQRNTWFDAIVGRQLNRVQDISSLRGQIAKLGEIAQLIRDRMAATKDVTRRLTLEDQLLDVLRSRRQTRATLSGELKQRADDAAQAAKEVARAAAEAKRAATERRFGWLDFAVERAQATKTVKDDLSAYRVLENALKTRIRQEGRTLDLVRQLWETRQHIADLNKSKAGVDPLAGLMQVSSRQLATALAAGTGLGVQGRRVLSANIAAAEIQPVHVHVNLDGREVAGVVSTHQARSGRRTSRQTSGFRG